MPKWGFEFSFFSVLFSIFWPMVATKWSMRSEFVRRLPDSCFFFCSYFDDFSSSSSVWNELKTQKQVYLNFVSVFIVRLTEVQIIIPWWTLIRRFLHLGIFFHRGNLLMERSTGLRSLILLLLEPTPRKTWLSVFSCFCNSFVIFHLWESNNFICGHENFCWRASAAP